MYEKLRSYDWESTWFLVEIPDLLLEITRKKCYVDLQGGAPKL